MFADTLDSDVVGELAQEPVVFVVDDDPEVRESLRLLAESVDLNVQTFSSARNFLDHFRHDRPACLVLDVRLPGMSGLELQAKLAEDGTDLPIIIITAYGEVGMAVRAMQNGAMDFVEKPFSRQTLLDRIQFALAHDVKARRRRVRRARLAARRAKLSKRERQIMDLLVEGTQTKQIAAQLDISPKTVDNHRAKILDKMGVDSVARLVWLTLQYVEQ